MSVYVSILLIAGADMVLLFSERFILVRVSPPPQDKSLWEKNTLFVFFFEIKNESVGLTPLPLHLPLPLKTSSGIPASVI